MPPRRKRRASGKKEPLRFVESPLHIPHISSPVFASDWPCTADVVPIEDATGHWVSPQFHRPPVKSCTTKPTATATLKTLKFLGDESLPRFTRTDTATKHGTRPSVHGRTLRSRRKTLELMESSELRQSPDMRRQSPDTDQSPLLTCLTSKKSTARISKKSRRIKVRKLDLGEDLDFTSLPIQTDLDNKTLEADNKTLEALPDVSSNFCPPQIDTPKLKDIMKHLEPPCSATIPSRTKSAQGYDTANTGKHTVLLQTPVRKHLQSTKVLAYDTPESDYGLSLREKQLKHRKRSKRRQ